MSFDYQKPHKIVNGVPVELTDAELSEQQDAAKAWVDGEKDRNNQIAIDQMLNLERASGLSRPMRDWILSSDVFHETAKKNAQSVEDQIGDLRAQLK